VNDVMKVAATAIIAAVCAVVVRKQAPEMGLVLGICSGAVIVLYCTGAMISVIDFMDKLAQMGGLSPAVLSPVMRTAGIAVVTRLASDFCRDAKEGGLASAVELAGTVLALLAVLPLMSAVLDMLTGLL